MTTALWIAVALALIALIALHLLSARALARVGDRSSRATIVLRAVNVAAVLAVVAFAYWKWVR